MVNKYSNLRNIILRNCLRVRWRIAQHKLCDVLFLFSSFHQQSSRFASTCCCREGNLQVGLQAKCWFLLVPQALRALIQLLCSMQCLKSPGKRNCAWWAFSAENGPMEMLTTRRVHRFHLCLSSNVINLKCFQTGIILVVGEIYISSVNERKNCKQTLTLRVTVYPLFCGSLSLPTWKIARTVFLAFFVHWAPRSDQYIRD